MKLTQVLRYFLKSYIKTLDTVKHLESSEMSTDFQKVSTFFPLICIYSFKIKLVRARSEKVDVSSPPLYIYIYIYIRNKCCCAIHSMYKPYLNTPSTILWIIQNQLILQLSGPP